MNPAAKRRDMIVDYLRQQGGSVSSDDGRGLTAAIASAVGYDDLPTLNGMLARLERQGVIERQIRGKRTYRITLLDEGSGAASRAGSGRGAAVRSAAPALPNLEELERTIGLLATRVAELEATIRAASKKRRFWSAS